VSPPFDSSADRHPIQVGRLLVLAFFANFTVVGATTLWVATGHFTLAFIGMFVLGVFLCPIAALIGYAGAARDYRARIHAAIAQARRDPLTGLPNRALADELLDEATHADTPMTVALIDVDGLHAINANLGLAAGDQYLVTVAARLAAAVPPGGVLVRQGGDEFTLLAPDTGPHTLADRIGANLAGRARIAGYLIQPRASVGVAATDPDASINAHHTRARADSAMYTAKSSGGNQIRVFDPARDAEPSPDGTRTLVRRRDLNPLAAAGVAWLPSPGDELIPVLLSPPDLRAVVHAVTTARDRWAQAAAEADAGAGRPASPASSDPGWMNIEPTPAGYAGIAHLAHEQQTRYTRLLQHLQPISDAADTLDQAGHTPAAAPATACVVLVGISAAFTPLDLEALVITAAEAVYGQPEDLSTRQRELAARAYVLLQDAIDG
jgi:diguanylate cyclase (GGDEF)-like protein